MGGSQWEGVGDDLFEYRSEVAHRGSTSMRPSVVQSSPFGGLWTVHVPAPPETSHYHQRGYFYLTSYPDQDAAFFWWVDVYPFSNPVTGWVGMCPWCRFELWTRGTVPAPGESVKTDPNVIPLNQWFRVEVEVNANAKRCRLIARLYLDPEAPVEGYDVELMSTWDETSATWLGVPYSPYQGGVGDTQGGLPWGPTDDDMGLYFDDIAMGPAALGWIGPSGGALSHSSTTSTATVGAPTISQTQPLTDVGGVTSTSTLGAPTLTVPPPLDPITPAGITASTAFGDSFIAVTFNQTHEQSAIPADTRLGSPRLARPPGTIRRPRVGVIERPGPLD